MKKSKINIYFIIVFICIFIGPFTARLMVTVSRVLSFHSEGEATIYWNGFTQPLYQILICGSWWIAGIMLFTIGMHKRTLQFKGEDV